MIQNNLLMCQLPTLLGGLGQLTFRPVCLKAKWGMPVSPAELLRKLTKMKSVQCLARSLVS